MSVAYSATYTATDGSSGDLPAVTATNTINLPVAEVQTLTTNHNNPRQNLGGQNGGDEGRDMFVTFAVVSTGWFPPG